MSGTLRLKSSIPRILMGASLTAFLCAAFTAPVLAESCTKSREHILANATDLPQRPQVYQELTRNCLETVQMSNVKDAYVLRVGAIAVVPRKDTVAATAATLAQFCARFPNGTLHFIGKKDLRKPLSVSRAVQLASMRATPCQKIMGNR